MPGTLLSRTARCEFPEGRSWLGRAASVGSRRGRQTTRAQGFSFGLSKKGGLGQMGGLGLGKMSADGFGLTKDSCGLRQDTGEERFRHAMATKGFGRRYTRTSTT